MKNNVNNILLITFSLTKNKIKDLLVILHDLGFTVYNRNVVGDCT